MIKMGKVSSLKPKVRLSKKEYSRLQQLKELAQLAEHPTEIKLYRMEMNSIINKRKGV